MNKPIVLLSAIVISVAGLSGCQSTTTSEPISSHSESDIQQWEYTKVFYRNGAYEEERALKEFNKLGAEGWELVGINVIEQYSGTGSEGRGGRESVSHFTAFLKRHKLTPSEK